MGLLFRPRFGASRSGLSAAQIADRQAVLDHPIYELVPLKSMSRAIDELPSNANVTITCSPVKGIDATLDLCESVIAAGHSPTPHLAARMVESGVHVDQIVVRLEQLEITEVFVIAGDAQQAHGPYEGAANLIEDLLDKAPFLDHVGFAAYPDGHALIDNDTLHEALHAKQCLLSEAGVAGHASTQMCFDSETVRTWLHAERAGGFELPVHLGVAGVVDRARLLSMGMRLGVGTSLRYLSKNRRSLTRLFASSSYEPTNLLDGMAGELSTLGIEAIHFFTFNQVGATSDWLAQYR